MFDKKLSNCFIVFLEKDRNTAMRFLDTLKEERDKCINLLISAGKWEDVRFLQGAITILNNLILCLEGRDGGT